MLNCEQWENVLKSIFDCGKFEVVVQHNKSESNVYVRKCGTQKPEYIKIYPKQKVTHVVLNHAVLDCMKDQLTLRKEDKFKGNEYHYLCVEDSFIKAVCIVFADSDIS